MKKFVVVVALALAVMVAFGATAKNTSALVPPPAAVIPINVGHDSLMLGLGCHWGTAVVTVTISAVAKPSQSYTTVPVSGCLHSQVTVAGGSGDYIVKATDGVSTAIKPVSIYAGLPPNPDA